MMSCLLRELPQGKTQTIHPQTRAVIQRGFRPCSKIWKCVCTPSDTDTNVSVYTQTEMLISWGTFHPNPILCCQCCQQRWCRSPSKQSKNQHQERLNNISTFILDSSQLSPCFLSAKPLLPATSNRVSSHMCKLSFLFLYSFHDAKDCIHCMSPKILFLIQKQIHVPVQTFLSCALLYKAHSY